MWFARVTALERVTDVLFTSVTVTEVLAGIPEAVTSIPAAMPMVVEKSTVVELLTLALVIKLNVKNGGLAVQFGVMVGELPPGPYVRKK